MTPANKFLPVTVAAALFVLSPIVVQSVPTDVAQFMIRNGANDYFQCHCTGLQAVPSAQWMHSGNEYSCFSGLNGTFMDAGCAHLSQSCMCKSAHHLQKRVVCITTDEMMAGMRQQQFDADAIAAFTSPQVLEEPKTIAAGEMLFDRVTEHFFGGDVNELNTMLAEFHDAIPELLQTFNAGERERVFEQIMKDVLRNGFRDPDSLDTQALSLILLKNSEGFPVPHEMAPNTDLNYRQAWAETAKGLLTVLPADKAYVVLKKLTHSEVGTALASDNPVFVDEIMLAIERFHENYPAVHEFLDKNGVDLFSGLHRSMDATFSKDTSDVLFAEIISTFLREGGDLQAAAKIMDATLARSIPEIHRAKKEWTQKRKEYREGIRSEIPRDPIDFVNRVISNLDGSGYGRYYRVNPGEFAINVRDPSSIALPEQYLTSEAWK